MQTEPQAVKKVINVKKLMMWSGIFFAAVVILIAAVLTITVIASNKIHPGIYIDETYVGKMTREGAVSALADLKQSDSVLTLKSGDVAKEVTLAELDTEFAIEESVDQAFAIGRTGNIFRRIYDYMYVKLHNRHIPIAVHCNDELLTTYIEEIASKVDQPQQEREITLEEANLIVKRGRSGSRINIEQAVSTVHEAMGSLSAHEVSLERQTVEPKPIDVDSIYEEVCGEPVDATYKVENYRMEIIPEKVGIQFDRAEAKRLIKETAGETVTIPVQLTQPQVNVEKLKASLFPDMLGKYSTKYNQGDRNRSFNVALASNNINGIVLAPGDVFSYNEAVGPRTRARGFKDAGVYVGNKVEQGIGGGICQVSSTLFNAVVLSDLNIVYRTNHSLTVSYVPRGRDATVSDGSIDFKFSNNTSAPVKIFAKAEGGVNEISIYGVKDDKSKTIDFAVENTGTTPYVIKHKDDPDLPEGKTKIEQKGVNGSSYNTYKITLINGKETKRELLTRSTYSMVEQVELVGKKKVSPSPSSAPPAEEPKADPPAEQTPAA